MQYCYSSNHIIETQISTYLTMIRNYFELHYPEKATIYLIGSLSRGEGSWVYINEKPHLISDIEYFIISDANVIDKVKTDIALIEICNIIFGNKNAKMFHVDYTYIYYSDISRMEKRLLVYEAKIQGKQVYGKDVSDLFPNITIDNINKYDIKDIINHRLFSILYYGFWARETLNDIEYYYTLAKNGLDLLTVYLIKEGILESGFSNRISKMRNTNISKSIMDYFEECANVKFYTHHIDKFEIDRFEDMFIKLAIELNSSFKVGFGTIFHNPIHIARRILGIFKRGIKSNIIFVNPDSHFNNMISELMKGKSVPNREKLCFEHFVLYGFPMMVH